MRYPTVFQPCRIGSLTLKNRLAMSQMTMNHATEKGMVTDKAIAYYRKRAKGGVGLIVSAGTVGGKKLEDQLYEQLKSIDIDVIKAGCCMKPRRIPDSVEEGYQAGNRI